MADELWTCWACKKYDFPTAAELISHLRVQHPHWPGAIINKCRHCGSECEEKFNNANPAFVCLVCRKISHYS